MPLWSLGHVLDEPHRPSAAVARRPRHPGWLIAVFAVVYLPLRWSVAAAAPLTSIPAAVAIAGHDQNSAGYFAQNTPLYPLTIGMLIFLVRAVAELRARRRELADTAVIGERLRIDDGARRIVYAGVVWPRVATVRAAKNSAVAN
jgi:hypothetical protein